jgi:hypothetical protein
MPLRSALVAGDGAPLQPLQQRWCAEPSRLFDGPEAPATKLIARSYGTQNATVPFESKNGLAEAGLVEVGLPVPRLTAHLLT